MLAEATYRLQFAMAQLDPIVERMFALHAKTVAQQVELTHADRQFLEIAEAAVQILKDRITLLQTIVNMGGCSNN